MPDREIAALDGGPVLRLFQGRKLAGGSGILPPLGE